ncbi:MAG: hybrid sensor histidine kinase/response regulator [Spartobacteria bacterium]|nr:hybrid sensor histidine kinase/response regulator [Spartobacteria bacterium]
MSTMEESLQEKAQKLEEELEQYESVPFLKERIRTLELTTREQVAAIEQLTAIINDLNNLLGIMRGHAELANRGEINIKQLTGVVLNSTERARQVIEQTVKSGELPDGPAKALQEAVALQSASILVVDDEHMICSLLDRLLTQGGHHVTVAEHPDEAIKACAEHTFDIVFMDVVLGPYRGVDCARAIKKAIPGIRVVFLSGRPNVEEMQRIAREEHAVGFIRKPFDINEIDNIIARIMK